MLSTIFEPITVESLAMMQQDNTNRRYGVYAKQQQTISSEMCCQAEAVISADSTSSQSQGSANSKWCQQSKYLGPDFTPGPHDVICARGKVAWNHSGNKFFRSLVKEATEAYSKVETKADRTAIVSRIVESIRSKGNGFVKQERENDKVTGGWIEVGDLLAREKVGQMLRNALSTQYRSSLKFKKQRRRNMQMKQRDGLHDFMESNKNVRKSMMTLEKGASRRRKQSDEELLAFFTQQQCNMLQTIASDAAFVDQFHQAEVTACMIFHDSGSGSDGDVRMKD